MTEDTPQPEATPPQIPLWLQATLEDIEAFDFEAPLVDLATTKSRLLFDPYHGAMKEAEARQDGRSVRVYCMLAAVANMHFRPRDTHEPFGPMTVMSNGNRSATPADFKGHVEQLSNMALRAVNPVLRARLADVTWMLDRKRAAVATAAISSYVAIINAIKRNESEEREEHDFGVLCHDVQDYLRRALQIGRAIGWDKPETLTARALGIELRELAFRRRKAASIYWFSYLDLDFDLSPSDRVSEDLEAHLGRPDREDEVNHVVSLWRLATMGYHQAKRDKDKVRCQIAAADRLVAEADAKIASPLLAAHFLTNAIVQLNSVPGQKERRKALRHKLIDVQANVSDEMSSFSIPLDIEKEAKATERALTGRSLIDKLFVFSALTVSPKPETLIAEAQEQIRKHPLSALFPTAHFDREGKVIARSDAAGMSADENEGAIRQQIAQGEGFRRQIVVGTYIEPARQVIFREHHLSDDILVSLLQQTPFVPMELLATYARGFLRFFQGDFVSAAYILTPLLEASLRYVLKNHGHDVTIFDDTTQLQQDRTLSSLFSQMRGELDAIFRTAITTDLENVLLNRPGPALRNNLAHGLLDDGDPYSPNTIYACWLMFSLCLKPLYPHRAQIVLL